LKAGDWVEIRSKQEILATLDQNGRLDALPFMPQMFQFCGQRFQVYKSAHKTCDTVNQSDGRRLVDAVHLEQLRCDGVAFGGCQAACLLFWKGAWLRRVDNLEPETPGSATERHSSENGRANGTTEEDVVAATRVSVPSDDGPTYSCQATELPKATALLKWWDLRQYVDDYRTGNSSAWRLCKGVVYMLFDTAVRASNKLRLGLAPAMITVYDRYQRLIGGIPYPRRRGTIPAGQRTPIPHVIGLQAGDRVRVKSYEEITKLLDTNNRNRGLYFDAEMVPYCDRTFNVRSVVDRIIDEKTGKLIPIKGNSVILDGAYCTAMYSGRRMGCPRSIYPIWREGWLEKVADPQV